VNEIELPRLAEMFDLTGDERSQIRQLADRNRLRVGGYTRGRHGSLLFSEGRWSIIPAPRRTSWTPLARAILSPPR